MKKYSDLPKKQKDTAMEIEIKYQIPDTEILENIWNDEDLMRLTVPDSTEIVPMRSLYYDTPDRALNKAGITLRVRSEGNEAFCTVKWNGKLVNGVHERQEDNIPVDISLASDAPDDSVFGQSAKGREISDLKDGSAFLPLVTMEFTRKRKRLDYCGSIMELALDRGKIMAEDKSCDILEMEIEHLEGEDPLTVLELGEVIADRYGLYLQPRSKYARGLALIK